MWKYSAKLTDKKNPHSQQTFTNILSCVAATWHLTLGLTL